MRELFAPGVLWRVRMQPDAEAAVAFADTCRGDCDGVEVWELDLSRYLGVHMGVRPRTEVGQPGMDSSDGSLNHLPRAIAFVDKTEGGGSGAVLLSF